MRRSAPFVRFAFAAALVGAAAAPPAGAQSPPGAGTPQVSRGDSSVVYRREVFRYSAAGRPDPFRPLVGSSEMGVRVEDLALRGVVYHPVASRSVAMLAREGVERPIRARVGDRIGGVRILAIGPNSIDVLVEELGVARRERLQITKATPKGTNP